MMGATSGAGTV